MIKKIFSFILGFLLIYQNAFAVLTIDSMEATCDTDAHAQAAYVTNGAGSLIRSNADIDDEDMADITDWYDDSSGTGDSSQVTFDSKSCMKLDSGSSAGDYALRNQDVGSFSGTNYFSFNLYHSALGTLANNDFLQIQFLYADVRLKMAFATDGLFVNDGATDNEVGTNLVETGVWQEWTFKVYGTTAATATCDVYLEGSLVASGVDCSATAGFTNGTVYLIQFGGTTTHRISYIDWEKSGSNYVTFGTPNLQSYSGSEVTVGTYSLKGVADASSLNKTLTRTVAYNLTGVTTLKFDMKASRTGSNIKVGLVDSGATTEVTPNQTGTGYQTNTIDLSAVSDANKDAITSVVVTIVNADDANTFYIDNFLESAGTGGGASFFSMN